VCRVLSFVMSTTQINSAIRSCLNRCYSSRTPLRDFSEYLNALFQSGAWTLEEVAAVRSAVVHILRSIAQPEDDAGMPFEFLRTNRARR
jgi:hypothetical protein